MVLPLPEHPQPTVVTARGSRFEVGHHHGRRVTDHVHATLAWSLQQLALAGVDAAEARERAGRLLPYVRERSPELLEEVRGIAEGAAMPLLDAFVINSRYELLFLGGTTAPQPGVPGAECTLFGVSGRRTSDGHPIIGQNVDLGRDSRELWIVLDVQPDDGPRVLTVTLAGMLAQEGINSHGLALCGSMIRSRGWREGYPTRKFLRRRVLEQPSVRAAIETIRSTPQRASSHNLLLADPTRMAEVETTPDDVHVLEPKDDMLAHANHYLSAVAESENRLLGDYLDHTQTRCNRMEQLIAELPAPVTVATLQAALRDHAHEGRAICRHAESDGWSAETNIAVVSEPARRTMHVAFGPPCEQPFHTFTIDDEQREARTPAHEGAEA